MALYLCPTPLGNLEDITLRVLRTLREVTVIAAEDTRHTRKLLAHYEIRTRLVSYHEHNKQKKTAAILEWLSDGMDVALVSDAGTPCIADPGTELVAEAISRHIPVVALPGPVAAVTALSASGLPALPFALFGFPPAKGQGRTDFLLRVMAEDKTAVLYEAPHRLLKTLEELAQMDGSRAAVVCREITKLHEEYIRGTLQQTLEHFRANEPRGEITLVLAPLQEKSTELPEAAAMAMRMIEQGMRHSRAIKETARLTGVSRNELYEKLAEKK